jgi:hypothetical protein
VWGGTVNGMAENDPTIVQWLAPALSPDGSLAVTNTQATHLSGLTTIPPMLTTKDGMPVTDSGLESYATYMPAWSPDGSAIAFVQGTYPAMPDEWDAMAAGPLSVVSFDATKSPKTFAEKDLVAADDAAGTHAAKGQNVIAWPSFSPDGKWIVYQRGSHPDTRGTVTAAGATYDNRPDLYLASVDTGEEIELSALNGTGYPFAAGDRDRDFSFEPTFAPVPAGGYFWIVFTSRRTYGNLLTGGPNAVKQMWVAAIDINPTPGKDPSHAAFHLEGQDPTSLNMRGFWALTPCKADGMGCGSGTDCCGGYCDSSGGSGAGMCKSSTTSMCAEQGSHCDKASDCCASSQQVECVAHVCTMPSPG